MVDIVIPTPCSWSTLVYPSLFQYVDMALHALRAMNRTYIGNNCINVRFAHRDKDKGISSNPSNNIYVCNLPKTYGEAEVYSLFSPFGAISSLIVLEDRKTGIMLLYLSI